MLAKFCPQDKAFLEDLKARGVKITAYDSIDFEDNYYDGKQWVKKLNPGGGQQDGNNVIIVKTGDPGLDASTIYHEGVHTSQPPNPDWAALEHDAYTKEDQWRARQNPPIPPMEPSWRRPDGTTNTAAIKASIAVDPTYPGMDVQTTPGGPTKRIVGVDARGWTLVSTNGGTPTARKPVKDDAYPGNVTIKKPAGGVVVDMNQLQCP
jgi:hypothetical protein